MNTRIAALAVAFATIAPANAQDERLLDRVELRVTATGPGGVVEVDRGRGDGVAVGDLVMFYMRDGGSLGGNVVELSDRSARVELHDPNIVPPAGSKGEVLIPKSRFARPTETVEPPPQQEIPETLPWENTDEDYTPDMPLLAQVKPVRPEERSMLYSGRIYINLNQTFGDDSDREDSFFRYGTDLLFENPFGRGGGFHFDGELNYRKTELPPVELQAEEESSDIRIDRLSYYRGGTRFVPQRWEAGRFLQHGMPEFGVVDGFEWGRRLPNGDRWGASVGFMPEPNADYETGEDFQVATYYDWRARPHLSIAGGFQTTLHNGHRDRNLLVTKIQYLPPQGWTFHGTTWIDFYDSTDDVKDGGLELTQAYWIASRRFDNGNGLNLIYRHIAFPELRRDEFRLLLPDDLKDNRTDRLTINGWRWVDDRKRFHARGGLWSDEDDSGGDAEAGVEIEDLFADRGRGDVTLFTSEGQFTSLTGVRLSYRKSFAKSAYWDVLYELARHDLEGFLVDSDDQVQQRFRASGGLYSPSGWSLSAFAESFFGGEIDSLSLGVYLQKSF